MSETNYRRGYDAFLNGDHRCSNPYQSGTHEWHDWDSGYYDAATLMEG